MPSVGKAQPPGKKYWRSLDELADTPQFREFMHREFPAGASELLSGPDRRHFLKIMGASMALAGLGIGGCRRWPAQEIAPFARRPAGRTPGVPRHYATSMELGGVAQGLLATSFDGRPTKIEGNPEHPVNRGKSDLFAQASVLDLYDPDRSRTPVLNGAASTWQAFSTWAAEHFGGLRSTGGSGMRILSEASDSPSLAVMKQRLKEEFPQSTWHEWEPLNNDAELDGTTIAFGRPYRVLNDFSRARVIVSLDGDFLGPHPASVRSIGDFAATRRISGPSETMSRLYVYESALSLTGANADHRAAVRSGDIGVVAAWLAARLLNDQSLGRFEQADGGRVLTAALLVDLNHTLADLQAHPGESVVVAGAGQPAEVHALVHLMNEALRNVGRTVTYQSRGEAMKHLESLASLVADLNAGTVDTLVIIGGNPVYDAPADLDFAAAMKNGSVRARIHLAHYVDETSQECHWHLNRAHALETWGDGRSWDGTITLCQPLIEPLTDPQQFSRSPIELLAMLTGDTAMRGLDIVRRTFAAMTGLSDSERAWRRALHDGFLTGSAITPESAAIDRTAVLAAAGRLFDRWSNADHGGWEIVFSPDPRVYDGRYANNGWLQELPHPITKLTWDNAAVMSPVSARALGVAQGDLVALNVGRYSTAAPVVLVPGMAPRTVLATLGSGRRFRGRICADAGFDFYGIRTSEAMSIAAGAVVRTDGRYDLATTQDHHAIDVETVGGKGIQERLPTLVREATLEHYREHPDFARHAVHVPHQLSLFSENHPAHQPTGSDRAVYAWGMSIDLSTCVGCNACVIACQAENNIPIVGKDQVMRGREMHWIRVDRYYTFDAATRDGSGRALSWDGDRLRHVALQPVACQHCENAPCEQVCPVAATTHDADGLNVMVYNRCVGTRYCSNNCPYKVRRFNYFDYHRRDPIRAEDNLLQVPAGYYHKPQADAGPLRSMQFNPEVTVRMRGIMEKCTFCLQRISAARIAAKNDWVRTPERERPPRPVIADGSLTTACAQACPADAIVFGDLLDGASRVAAMHRRDRSYEMLEELNVKPRNRYLAKLRNPAAGGAGEAATGATEATGHG